MTETSGRVPADDVRNMALLMRYEQTRSPTRVAAEFGMTDSRVYSIVGLERRVATQGRRPTGAG